MDNQQNLIDLKHIEQNAFAHVLMNALLNNTADELPKQVLIPDGYSLKSTEYLKAVRDRFSGSFGTASVAEWAEYISNQNLIENMASCFIDGDRLEAKAVLDLGNIEQPGHCKHKANLSLEWTPEYSFLLNELHDTKMYQKKMSELLEEWADFVSAEDEDGEPMTAKELVQCIRKITVEAKSSQETEVGQYSENMSALEQIEARNKERMPAWIYFKCKPAEDLEDRQFTLRLSVIAESGKPVLVMRVMQLSVIKNRIAEEFKELTKAALAETPVKTYVGSGSF